MTLSPFAAAGNSPVVLRQLAGTWYNWILLILAAAILIFIILRKLKIKR